MTIGRINLLFGGDSAVLRPGPLGHEADRLLAAAEAGSADAQTLYGQTLLDDAAAVRDEQGAVFWFWQASVQGHAMAMNMLGRCYESGHGVKIDKQRASEWYGAAADRGSDWAMYNLAILKALGEGVAQDLDGATALFARIVSLGSNGKAINYIAAFHEEGWVYDHDMAEAARLYECAARRGHPRAMFNHARMLLDAGRRSAALLWFEKALDAGDKAFGARVITWLEERALPIRTSCSSEPRARAIDAIKTKSIAST